MQALSLEYHDVVVGSDADETGFPGAGPGSYKLSAAEFERHLDDIARTAPAGASRATDWLLRPAGRRPLFITFDDGGRSAYTFIADALERRGWRGHFFVTTDRIGTPTFVNPAEMRELHARGHIIGSHSCSHPARMGGLTRPALDEEWRRSTAILSDILGEPVITGSVPGGFYTRPVAESAAAAGMRLLFTSSPTTRCHTVDGCRVLGRYTLRRWSTARTAGALGKGAWTPRAAQWALYTGLNVARTVGGDTYTRLRQRYWATQR